MNTLEEKVEIGSRAKPIQYKITDSGCWEVTSHGTNKDGYCIAWRKQIDPNKKIFLHRYSYQLHKGEIPKGMLVLHSCDNKKCINPSHLRIGTHRENMDDINERNNHNRKLTKEQVNDIYYDDRSATELSELYGITRGYVDMIKKGKALSHLIERR